MLRSLRIPTVLAGVMAGALTTLEAHAEDARPDVAPAAAPPTPAPDVHVEPAPASPARPSRHGPSVGLGGGANVSHPYLGAQLGYRFARAEFLELLLDYSYDAAIPEFTFQTASVGARTFFASFGRVELYHQALLGVALSSGGTTEVPKREIGERLLGAFVTQGVGAELEVWRGFHAALTLSTGYPVWLRPELAVRYRF